MVKKTHPGHVSEEAKSVSTTTSQGQLDGLVMTLRTTGGKFTSFITVPYAHIPVYQLKFAPPKPIKNWNDDHVLRIVQNNRGKLQLLENVLYMDIHTPQVEFEKKKDIDTTRPVILFIPGDVHRARHTPMGVYGPQYLIKENVVVVIVSYRQGIMGFLRAENPAANAPGNVGLMDLEMVFEWVKNEIGNFGGDPENITAYGQGLGASHLLKILASAAFDEKDLFHKAILSSCIEHKIYNNNNLYQDGNFNAIYLANTSFGGTFETQDEVNCVNYLRIIPESFIQGVNATTTSNLTKETFLPEEIIYLCRQLYRKRMPIIIGYNSREFLYTSRQRSILHYTEFLLKHGAVDITHEDFAVQKLSKFIMEQPMWPHESRVLGNLQQHPRASQIQISSEFTVICGVMAIAGNLAREMAPQNVFLYCFDIDEDPQAEQEPNNSKELQYIFGSLNYYRPHIGVNLNVNLIDLMTKLWAQFARTGDPNPPKRPPLMSHYWQAIGAKLSHCLTFTKTGAKYALIPNIANFSSWEEHFGVKFFSLYTKKPAKKRRTPIISTEL